ncbi:MAG: gliding motility-associated C-terminal domain-containing protein, partial [Daejeonella sp.]|nr:gliding motility-associated C-terminal domain-containing protein [Daejeonella sp.]
GVVKTIFSYDKTEGDPNLYSIIWDQKGLAGGLINVTDQVLPPGSFEITMPATLADGIYNGALKVRNSSTGESSTGSIFTLVIPEPPKISPITGSGTVLVGSNTTLSTSTATSAGIWSSNAPAIATVNAVNGQVTGIAEGSAIITYTLSNALGCTNTANFSLLVVSASSQQTLNFQALPEKIYGDDDFTPTVFTAEAGAVIVFTSADPKVATINASGQIKITGAGTSLITASKATNSAVFASQLLTVKPKSLIIKAKDQNRAYGTPNPELTLDYIGFANGENDAVLQNKAVVTTTASLSSTPGTYPIVVSSATAANYLISYQLGVMLVNKADQILTFDPIPNKMESDPVFPLNASVNSGLTLRFISSDNLIAEIINGNQVKINKPGTVRIEAIQMGDSNYNPLSVFREFTIYPSIFSVSSNSFTPNGDGINDQWILKGLESDKTAMVQIYNRYGRMVFGSSGYTTPWDGHHQGAKLPQGTYYYKISVRSGKQVVSGMVTLIY